MLAYFKTTQELKRANLWQADVFFMVDCKRSNFVAVDLDKAALVVLRSGFDWRRSRVDWTVHRETILEVLGEPLLNML